MEELEREWKTFREKLKNWSRPYIKFVIKRLDETVNIDASRYIAVGMFAIFYIYEALVKQLMVMFWWQSGLLILLAFIGLLIWDWKKSFLLVREVFVDEDGNVHSKSSERTTNSDK